MLYMNQMGGMGNPGMGMGMNQMGGMGMGGPSMGMMAGGWDNDYYQVFRKQGRKTQMKENDLF